MEYRPIADLIKYFKEKVAKIDPNSENYRPAYDWMPERILNTIKLFPAEMQYDNSEEYSDTAFDFLYKDAPGWIYFDINKAFVRFYHPFGFYGRKNFEVNQWKNMSEYIMKCVKDGAHHAATREKKSGNCQFCQKTSRGV